MDNYMVSKIGVGMSTTKYSFTPFQNSKSLPKTRTLNFGTSELITEKQTNKQKQKQKTKNKNKRKQKTNKQTFRIFNITFAILPFSCRSTLTKLPS